MDHVHNCGEAASYLPAIALMVLGIVLLAIPKTVGWIDDRICAFANHTHLEGS